MSVAGGLNRLRSWMAARGYVPMSQEPVFVLNRPVTRRGAGGRPVSRQVMQGGSRKVIVCDDCGCNFADIPEAAHHAALTDHVVMEMAARAFVAVDPDDDPSIWEDEFGVPNAHRYPEGVTA